MRLSHGTSSRLKCISELKVGDILIPKESWGAGIICKPYHITKLGAMGSDKYVNIYSGGKFIGQFNLYSIYKWNKVIRVSFKDYYEATRTR